MNGTKTGKREHLNDAELNGIAGGAGEVSPQPSIASIPSLEEFQAGWKGEKTVETPTEPIPGKNVGFVTPSVVVPGGKKNG